MIHRLAILLLLAGFANLSAQSLDFNINWGQEFEGPKRSTLFDIIGHDSTGIFAIRVHYGAAEIASYTIERYDRKFIPIRSSELEVVEDGERASVQQVLYLGEELYMFYVIPNRVTHKNELFVRLVNKNTLKPGSAKLKLGQTDVGKLPKEIRLKIRTSRDNSKVAVSYEFPKGLTEKKSYGFFVLDNYLQLLWKPKVVLPYEEENFVVENFKVDNDGNVYLLGVYFKDNRARKRDGTPDYHYEVLAWSAKGEVMRSYPIVLEDRFITDMQIEVIDTKNLVCAGFYSTDGTFGIRGTYFVTVDLETKNIKTASFREFDVDFVMQKLSERDTYEAKKREPGEDPGLFDYDLDKLLVGKDGSAILVGEQYFIEEVTTSNFMAGNARLGLPTMSTSRYYYYNDIIAVKIDSKGQIQWARKVAKNQRTLNDGGYSSSYALAIVKGNICFFFNDRSENLDYKDVGRPLPYYRTKDSIVMLATLDQRGEQTRQSVFASNNEVVTRPKACEQVSNREVILFGQWLKTQRFASLVFE